MRALGCLVLIGAACRGGGPAGSARDAPAADAAVDADPGRVVAGPWSDAPAAKVPDPPLSGREASRLRFRGDGTLLIEFREGDTLIDPATWKTIHRLPTGLSTPDGAWIVQHVSPRRRFLDGEYVLWSVGDARPAARIRDNPALRRLPARPGMELLAMSPDTRYLVFRRRDDLAVLDRTTGAIAALAAAATADVELAGDRVAHLREPAGERWVEVATGAAVPAPPPAAADVVELEPGVFRTGGGPHPRSFSLAELADQPRVVGQAFDLEHDRAAFSLATYQSRLVVVYALDTGRAVVRWDQVTGILRFAPDGSRLYVLTGDRLRALDLTSGREIATH